MNSIYFKTRNHLTMVLLGAGFLSACNSGGATSSAQQVTTQPKVAVYYYNEIGPVESVATTLQNVDEVLYSFWNVNSDYSGHIVDPLPKLDLGTATDYQANVQDVVKIFKSTNSGYLAQACNVKINNPQVQFVLSLGGWGGSNLFSKSFSTISGINNFVNDAQYLITNLTCQNGVPLFSGYDVDWEYPQQRIDFSVAAGTESSQDTQNLHTLIIQLRQKLGQNAIISMALPHGNNDLDGGSINKYFQDFRGNTLNDSPEFINATTTFNVMAYDFMAFATYTIPNAPLYSIAGLPSIDDGIIAMVQNKVPPSKILLGAPAYGRSIGSNVQGQKCLATSPTTVNSGVNITLPEITDVYGKQDPCLIQWPLYRNIAMNNFNQFDSSLTQADQTVYYWDTFYGAPNQAGTLMIMSNLEQWEQNNMMSYQDFFMSFDSPYDIAQKSNYIKQKKLAGMFFWEVSQDKAYNSDSIVINNATYPLSLIQTANQFLK